MKKLFTFTLPGFNKRVRVSWDEMKIKQFLETHGLKDVKIRFCKYESFLDRLLIRITKKAPSRPVGDYGQLTRILHLYFDIIIYTLMEVIDEFLTNSSAEAKMVCLKQKLPRALAYTLGHELGHAKKRGFAIFAEEILIAEEFAQQFAKQHRDELEVIFFIEEGEQ